MSCQPSSETQPTRCRLSSKARRVEFADLTPYTFLEPEPDTLNVGWLDATKPFPTGSNEPAFVDRLRVICKRGMNRTRGLHRCNLCPTSPIEDWPPRANRIQSSEGEYVVGGAEIRVVADDGKTYAAPDMIVHYVDRHAYQPPKQFVAAVMRS